MISVRLLRTTFVERGCIAPGRRLQRGLATALEAYRQHLRLVPTTGSSFSLAFKQNIVKSPSGIPVDVPTRPMGELLLAALQGHLSSIKEKPLPMVSLVYRALDLRASPELRTQVVDELLAFTHTDSLCYFDSNPEILPIQEQSWLPILGKIRRHRGFETIGVSHSVAPANHHPSVIPSARAILLGELDSFQLAGFEHLTRNFKSLFLPLALHDGLISADQAVEAALLESEAQSRKWGVIEDYHALHRSQLSYNAHLGNLFLSS